MAALQSYLPLWMQSRPGTAGKPQIKKIEDYQSGYPRYTALLSAYNPYLVCRRFDQLRARVLLMKQDRLSVLEQKLEEVDRNETSLLYLGKSRCDRNPERISVLSEIGSCLADYENFIERTNKILSLSTAQGRDIESLQNWLDGNGCLAREEIEYLSHRRELVTLSPVHDNALMQVEAWIEDKLIRFRGKSPKTQCQNISNDPNVFFYTGPNIHRTARALLLCLITLLLLLPVVICNATSTNSSRILIILVSTVLYLAVISELTQSKTMELVVAGATYATVLTVFVSNTNTV